MARCLRRSGVNIDGADGVVLDNLKLNGAAGGFGLALSSTKNVVVTDLATASNALGAVGIFPTDTTHQLEGFEHPGRVPAADSVEYCHHRHLC